MTEQLDIFKQGLTDEEFSVWQIIERHKGRENAVKVDSVAWQARLNGKEVREIVNHLIMEHGKLIGSVTGTPPGYYIITNTEELKKHIKSLRHRGIAILSRAAALSKTSIEDIFGQGRLEYEQNQGRV